MNKLEFAFDNKIRLIEELEEKCPPGFTGMIELFSNLQDKCVDRYYARGHFKNGVFHNSEKEAAYMNYKDIQIYQYYIDGVFYGSVTFNVFDLLYDELQLDGCNYINKKDVILIEKREYDLNWVKFNSKESIEELPMFEYLVKIVD